MSEPSAKSKIKAFLRGNVGVVVDNKQLNDVAGVDECGDALAR